MLTNFAVKCLCCIAITAKLSLVGVRVRTETYKYHDWLTYLLTYLLTTPVTFIRQ